MHGAGIAWARRRTAHRPGLQSHSKLLGAYSNPFSPLAGLDRFWSPFSAQTESVHGYDMDWSLNLQGKSCLRYDFRRLSAEWLGPPLAGEFAILHEWLSSRPIQWQDSNEASR